MLNSAEHEKFYNLWPWIDGDRKIQRHLPYFLGYKADFFSFQNNPKDLDPFFEIVKEG